MDYNIAVLICKTAIMNNPFEIIQGDLAEIKTLVNQLLRTPKKELSNKQYTIKEAAALLKVDKQTIRNHITRGNIKANYIGRRILIAHSELFDALNEVKSIKYKR
jgi:excisionase family DNA binding protein